MNVSKTRNLYKNSTVSRVAQNSTVSRVANVCVCGEVIKPGLDSGLEWNLESLHTRTRSITSMLRRLLFRCVLVAIDGVRGYCSVVIPMT